MSHEAHVFDLNPPETASGQRGGRFSLPRALAQAQLQQLITAPVSVPMGTVVFTIAASILALLFLTLFVAQNSASQEGACTLLLTAASATAHPAALTLTGVRDPTTLVCLGKRAPLVREDTLAALLAAHPKAFEKAQAQLSFTPVATSGAANASARWAISLDVAELHYNTTLATATIEVRVPASETCLAPVTRAWPHAFNTVV
jgi:hypothetical protein